MMPTKKTVREGEGVGKKEETNAAHEDIQTLPSVPPPANPETVSHPNVSIRSHQRTFEPTAPATPQVKKSTNEEALPQEAITDPKN